MHFYHYRIIKKQNIENDSLDGFSDPIDYIAARLKWDDVTRQRVLKSCPSLKKCNMLKVKIHQHLELIKKKNKHFFNNFRFERIWISF